MCSYNSQCGSCLDGRLRDPNISDLTFVDITTYRDTNSNGPTKDLRKHFRVENLLIQNDATTKKTSEPKR